MDWKNYYQIIPYTDHIFRIASPEGVFIELFVGSHHALLLDTGVGFGDLKGAVRSVTSLPLIVANTHGHLDHCNGNHLFPGYPVYMNENDWPMYRENFDPQQRNLCFIRLHSRKCRHFRRCLGFRSGCKRR